ncbi:sigma-54-dependent transcriptional regulator [Pectinatus frisingensis]|uniref:sigma-54-dependent transcriptional regulator n=1 Tax=Pectinatus frisingensis TaxID=865 RepID=UPI0015F448C8|nr:sigma 54-interacting transcriptional regulator [Pectinatus frisingensis]
MHYSRSQKIFHVLKEYGNNVIKHTYPEISPELGCTTIYIANNTGILRNNVSMELNTALKQDRVLKINGKPVLYIEKTLLEKTYNIHLHKNIFSNFIEFKNYLTGITSMDNPLPILTTKIPTRHQNFPAPPVYEKNLHTGKNHDVFDNLIGISDDLYTQSKQAKAAILYPPNGLHTLITGPTGSGKTTFANIMYRYAIEMKTLKKNAPFIIFNCSDYAENTQLLLSHLFGHTKGAFTGAFKETTGLVGQADGGILFLDEIHRLPPEGQEMLFSLIDHGKYRKLGESENFHKANVLILAATTENPQSAILKTFFRRIPILITLPMLSERPLKVRMKFINHFFQTEAKIIKKPLIVSKEVIKVLLTYKCSGNIGQLHNDIQVLCANAFIENVLSVNPNNTPGITIKLSQLTDNLKNEFFQSTSHRQGLYKTFNFNDITSITFDGTNDQLSDLLIKDDYAVNAAFYEDILKTAQSFYKDGIAIETIKEKIHSKLHRQKNNINDNKKVKIDKEILNKIVNTDIIHLIKNHLSKTKDYFDTNDNKMIYSLALHLEMLKDRLENGQSATGINVKDISAKYPNEYVLSKNICSDAAKLFAMAIPPEEIAIIASFFHTIKQNKSSFIPIIVVCHGRSTASSMVEVVKALMGNPEIYAIDMPLDAKIDTTLTLAIDLSKRINTPRGILMLVDMGSLVDFGDMINAKFPATIKTINNISTPLLLEAARRCMMPDITLNDIARLLNNQFIYTSQLQTESSISNSFSWAEGVDLQLFNKIITSLSDITTFIDVKKATDLLGQSLHEVLTNYNQTITDNIFVKFIFHSICMLERVIRKEALPYKNYSTLKKSHYDLFDTIQKSFSPIEEIYGIVIPVTELSYVVEMFLLFLPPTLKK